MNTPTLIEMIQAARDVEMNNDNFIPGYSPSGAHAIGVSAMHSRLAPALICAVEALEGGLQYLNSLGDLPIEDPEYQMRLHFKKTVTRIREMLEGEEPKV